MKNTVESGVRNHAKATIKAMLITAQTFNAQNERHPTPEGSTFAGISRQALECRPGWKRIPNSNQFVYEKSGIALEIPDSWSLYDVIRQVVVIEVAAIVSHLASGGAVLVAEAMQVVDDSFKDAKARASNPPQKP